MKKILLTVSILILSSQLLHAAPDAARVVGDLRISGTGSGLVFPDGSIQYKAAQDPPGGSTVGVTWAIESFACTTNEVVINCPDGTTAISGGFDDSITYYAVEKNGLCKDGGANINNWCLKLSKCPTASDGQIVTFGAYAVCIPGSVKAVITNGSQRWP